MYPFYCKLYIAVFLFVTNKKITCCTNAFRKVSINPSKSRFLNYHAFYSKLQKMLTLRASLPLPRPVKIHQPSYKSKPGEKSPELTVGWETIQSSNLYNLETPYAEDLPHTVLRNPPKTETPYNISQKIVLSSHVGLLSSLPNKTNSLILSTALQSWRGIQASTIRVKMKE